MYVEICRVLACHSIRSEHVHLTLMSHTFEFCTQQQSISVTYMGLDRCQIIGYCGLSDSICTDLSFCSCYGSYTWAAQLIRGVCNLDISFICWFRVIVSTAEEAAGLGDKG